MIRTRLGLSGLCAVLLYLAALSAGAAQGKVGAKWLLAKSDGTLVSFLEASLGLETDVPWVLHTEISKIKVLYLCSAIQAENARLKPNGTIGEGFKVKFSGCTTDLNGSPSKPCEPNSEGKEAGVFRTKPLHGLLEGELISILPDNVEGKTSKIFGTVEMTKECAIGGKVSVFGSLAFKDSEGLLTSHLVKHLLEVGSGTKLWTVSETPEHETFILGSRWAFLIGAHLGMKFGGDPF